MSFVRSAVASFRKVPTKLVVLSLLAALVLVLAVAATRSSDAPAVTTAQTVALPFDMPSTAELRASPRKVFANYFTPLPISIDNEPADSDYYARNYLSPSGENGKHAAYGGLIRDRPLPRDPSSSPDWQLEDLKTEVREAIAGGIDGFYLDVLQLADDPDARVWQTTRLMMTAAEQTDPGFKIVINPDLAGSLKKKSVAQLAAATAELAASPSAYRLADGRLVVMPTAAEAHPVRWWRSYLSTMESRYHLQVALVPVFIADEADYRDAFAPISYGMSVWGSANPQWNDPNVSYATSPKGRAAAVHALDKLWVQPVRVQDERPYQGVFNEAQNTTNLRTTWQLARETNAEWVHLPTWNDYTEGAQLAPSVQHGWTYLDISSYYLAWYKTGAKPRIVRDVVYLTHRTQPWAAQPTYPQSELMTLKGGTPPRDTVEALTFLTAPGTVTVTIGDVRHSCEVPAGVGVCTVPLEAGEVSADVTRSGAEVASVTSPYRVSNHPYVQDLQYVAAGSSRPVPAEAGTLLAPETASSAPTPTADGSASRAATAPGQTPSATRDPQTGLVLTSVVADADTYVNQSAPDASFYSEKSLASRGKPGYVAYLHFSIPAAPDGKTLVAARLRLYGSSFSFAGSKDSHLVFLEPRGAIDAHTTWADRPGVSGPVVATFDGDLDRNKTRSARVDLEALTPRVGSDALLAVTSRGRDNWWFASIETKDAVRRPTLELDYR